MARHVGIVACSAEGAALCYRTFCTEAAQSMGPHDHPEVSIHTHPLARYMGPIRTGDWDAVAELMLDSARRLQQIGAELLICPDNTIHQAMERVERDTPLPWLHIAREVVTAAAREGFRRLAVTGTKYLMTGPVYRDAVAAGGLDMLIPDAGQRETINRIIFDELVYGRILPESRQTFHAILDELKSSGADAAVLGCTELPLLADPATCPLPLLDSTRILARAAIVAATA